MLDEMQEQIFPQNINLSHISIIILHGCYLSGYYVTQWDKSIKLLFYEQTPIGPYLLYAHCMHYLACKDLISEISY